MKHENKQTWRISETNPDPHFLSSSHRAANRILDIVRSGPTTYTLDQLPVIDETDGLLRAVPFEHAEVIVSQLGDFEAHRKDHSTPHDSRALLAELTHFPEENVIVPITKDHTNRVNVVRGRSDIRFIDSAGVNALTDEKGEPISQDGVIIVRGPDTEDLVLEIPDADCVKIVGYGELNTGEEVVFGAHCGFKGTLRGIVENMGSKLKDLGIMPGSVKIVVGYGSQASTIPVEDLRAAADENEHGGTREHWLDAVSGSYVDIGSDKREKVVYSNQSDVLGRVGIVFNGLLSKENPITVIDSNTVTEDRLRSYRADSALRRQYGHVPADKGGRNITRISFRNRQ